MRFNWIAVFVVAEASSSLRPVGDELCARGKQIVRAVTPSRENDFELWCESMKLRYFSNRGESGRVRQTADASWETPVGRKIEFNGEAIYNHMLLSLELSGLSSDELKEYQIDPEQPLLGLHTSPRISLLAKNGIAPAAIETALIRLQPRPDAAKKLVGVLVSLAEVISTHEESVAWEAVVNEINAFLEHLDGLTDLTQSDIDKVQYLSRQVSSLAKAYMQGSTELASRDYCDSFYVNLVTELSYRDYEEWLNAFETRYPAKSAPQKAFRYIRKRRFMVARPDSACPKPSEILSRVSNARLGSNL